MNSETSCRPARSTSWRATRPARWSGLLHLRGDPAGGPGPRPARTAAAGPRSRVGHGVQRGPLRPPRSALAGAVLARRGPVRRMPRLVRDVGRLALRRARSASHRAPDGAGGPAPPPVELYLRVRTTASTFAPTHGKTPQRFVAAFSPTEHKANDRTVCRFVCTVLIPPAIRQTDASDRGAGITLRHCCESRVAKERK